MSDTGGGWQVARRRKGGRISKLYQLSPSSTCSSEALDVRKVIKRVRETMSELICEEFWDEWREQILVAGSSVLSNPPGSKDNDVEGNQDGEASQQWECVCYGLGSFSSSVAARYQLAMLLLLLDAKQISVKDCSVYDPVFTSGEIDVLRELGVTVLTENEEGKRLSTRPTVFYLIHCGKALYNNLLWKNWSARCLPLIKIIGNSFTSMKERTLEREFKQDYSYVALATAVCQEKMLPCPSRMIDVFSDTAVITFAANSLNSLPQSTWTDPPEPEYQHCSDLEIIQRGN